MRIAGLGLVVLLAWAGAGCDSKLKACQAECLDLHKHYLAKCVGPQADACKAVMHKKTDGCMFACKSAAAKDT